MSDTHGIGVRYQRYRYQIRNGNGVRYTKVPVSDIQQHQCQIYNSNGVSRQTHSNSVRYTADSCQIYLQRYRRCQTNSGNSVTYITQPTGVRRASTGVRYTAVPVSNITAVPLSVQMYCSAEGTAGCYQFLSARLASGRRLVVLTESTECVSQIRKKM